MQKDLRDAKDPKRLKETQRCRFLSFRSFRSFRSLDPLALQVFTSRTAPTGSLLWSCFHTKSSVRLLVLSSS